LDCACKGAARHAANNIADPIANHFCMDAPFRRKKDAALRRARIRFYSAP
jgi:hypothetical protein